MAMLEKILIITNLVVALAGAGLVYFSHNMIKPAPTDQLAEEELLKKEALDQVQVRPVPIKKFVVNLHSRSTRLRYLDVEMNILPFRDEQKEFIKSHEHILKDVVIEVASQLVPDELDSLSGKILFEKKVKDRVNEKLGQPGNPLVNKIYFSGFVVQ